MNKKMVIPIVTFDSLFNVGILMSIQTTTNKIHDQPISSKSPIYCDMKTDTSVFLSL